jgi:hypothetical protein
MVLQGEGGVFSCQRVAFGEKARARRDPHETAERVREAEELLRVLAG